MNTQLIAMLYIILPLLLLPLVLPHLIQARPSAGVLLMADGPELAGAELPATSTAPQPADPDRYMHCCVVDADGHYVEFVLVLIDYDAEGAIYNVQHYTLNAGEQLVKATPPAMRPYAGAIGFIRPRWDFNIQAWYEDANPVEIAMWELEHPAPAATPAAPSLEEDMMTVLVDHEARLTAVEEGVTL